MPRINPLLLRHYRQKLDMSQDELAISIARAKPPGQKGLKRPVGDGNLWTFRIVPEPGLIWVKAPTGVIPAKARAPIPNGDSGAAAMGKCG